MQYKIRMNYKTDLICGHLSYLGISFGRDFDDWKNIALTFSNFRSWKDFEIFLHNGSQNLLRETAFFTPVSISEML